MNVLVIGSGGREHAICTKFAQSNKINKVYVSPGNSGMVDCAELVNLNGFAAVEGFCGDNDISFVFVGPEQPLADGLADYLNRQGIAVIGPGSAAARMESSKQFAKEVMAKAGVPTAASQSFSDFDKALQWSLTQPLPLVIKADGLAAGKGVVIATTRQMVEETLSDMLANHTFGKAGNSVLIEEFMQGWETSIFAFCAGRKFVSTVFCQDHKPVFDGDKGPNTGGMGAWAPVGMAEQWHKQVDEQIFAPVLSQLADMGTPYRGVLFAGLMMTKDGPKVVEFNCRFGDPETEVLLPLLKTDLTDICLAILNQSIDTVTLEWEQKIAVTVTVSSQGYPGAYPKGVPIKVDKALAEQPDTKVYWAGVSGNPKVTAGGRVFMLTSCAATLQQARTQAYNSLKLVGFEGMHYRGDIGVKGL